MKHLKRFNESSDFEYDTWEEITESLDVYQLYELLQFKYGEVLTDSIDALSFSIQSITKSIILLMNSPLNFQPYLNL